MSRQKVQYTIREVPSAVDQALREKARRLGRSLNSVAREALAQGAGLQGALYRDLDAFFGSWTEDKAVDDALAEQRQIDKRLWR